MKPSIGVMVGRFQVHELHDAHLELFKIVRSRHDNVVVFLGIAPTGLTKYNPLDFIVRKKMIQKLFPDITVVPIADVNNDELWSQNLDSMLRSLSWGDITLYGGRDSFVTSYKGSYKPVELPIIGAVSGTDIRDKLTNIVMESADFRAGIIYATANIRPHAVMTVDIAILRNTGDGRVELLLGRKTGETYWRFIGGHVESGQKLEDAVKAEVMEETGLSVDSLEYVGSEFIDDWRWKKEVNKVTTAFFIAWAHEASAKAASDIAEVKWFDLTEIVYGSINPIHRPLAIMLAKHRKDENVQSNLANG